MIILYEAWAGEETVAAGEKKEKRKRSGGSFLVTSSEEQCRFWDFLQAFIIFIINRKICSGHIKLKLETTEECFNGHSEDKEWLNLSIIHHHLPGSSVKCFAYLNNLISKTKALFSPVLYIGGGEAELWSQKPMGLAAFSLSHNKTVF